MTEKTLIIAILVALILLWFAETLNMKKTSKVLGGAIDLAFAILLEIKIILKKKKPPQNKGGVHSYFLFFVDYGKILCV